VSQTVGSDRARLSGARRQTDRPCARAPRRKAATAHQRHVSSGDQSPATLRLERSRQCATRFASASYRSAVAVALTVLCVQGVSPAARQRAGGLTAAPLLARVYSAIFDAQFARVPTALGEACGSAPPEACMVLNDVALWWQIRLDPF